MRRSMYVNTIVRRFRSHLTAFALVALSVTTLVGCNNREATLVIEKPTEVHSMDQVPPSPGNAVADFQPGHVIVTLTAGDTARTVGVYQGKDFDAFQVKLSDGTEGLILAGDTFKVVSR
jgi:uncharacterized lipoprotein NlpE involved in copper resistance